MIHGVVDIISAI